MIFSSISENLGFHSVLGAFFGALLIDKRFFAPHHYKDVEHTLNSVSGGFLAPVFFAALGLEFELLSISSVTFMAAILAVSIISKVAAGWIGGRLIGMPNERAFGVGIILNGRGVMELVIASIAYERGFIGQGLFSALVLMGVVTTMMTPLMMKQWVMPKLK
jgi:Kef-type K+ transport system membrane component KefB